MSCLASPPSLSTLIKLAFALSLGLSLSLSLSACDAQGSAPSSEVIPLGGVGGGTEAGTGAGAQSEGGVMMSAGVEALGEGPLFNSILPTRASRAGGLSLRIIGGDFRAPMEVLIGGEPCVELTIESVSRLRCVLPPWPQPEAVDVSVAWADEGEPRVLANALTYYEEVRLLELSPAQGPAQGSTEVTLTGEGFEEPTEVRFGGLPALSVEVIDAQTIKALTPPSTPRLADVTLQNANGSGVLRDAYRWVSPIDVERLSPAWVWSTGGERVTLYGYGLYEDARVSFEVETGAGEPSGGEARLLSASAPSSLSVESPPASPGWATLSLTSGNGEVRRERALLYLDPTPGVFDVLGLTPSKLPSDEGGYFEVGGNGFTVNTEVRVAGERVGCELLAPQRLKCFSPARSVGVFDVEVRDSAGAFSERRTLSLAFYARLALYELTPPRASTAGGALIKLTGRGFSPSLELKVSDSPVALERFVSAEELWFRAPPHPVGLADLSVTSPALEVGGEAGGEAASEALGEQRAYLPDAITYINPLSRYGGVWGEPIERSVNVTALNIYDLSPVEGVYVEVRPFDEPVSEALATGLTPESGQVTLSAEDLTAPVAITGFKENFEVVTLERVVSENVTLILIPYEPPPEGEGDPPPAPLPALITGRLEGLSALPKPIEEDETLRGFVDVSHPSLLGRRLVPAPSPLGILTEDGDFELLVDAGQMSIVATAAYVQNWALNAFERGQMTYWTMRSYSRPIAMGVVRHLSLSPEAELRDVLVRLTYVTDRQAAVTLLNPSETPPDLTTLDEPIPATYSARAFLTLGADGYWELDVEAKGESTSLRVQDLPRMEELPADIGLQWVGQANLNERVTSVAYLKQRNTDREVRLGPLVGAPYITSHTVTEPVRLGDTLRWAYWPGLTRPTTEPPEVVRVRLLQGGRPMWTYTLPGGVQELTLPPIAQLDPPVGLRDGPFDVMFEAMTSYGRFDYQDYTLLDLSDPQSYTIARYPLMFTVFPEEPSDP